PPPSVSTLSPYTTLFRSAITNILNYLISYSITFNHLNPSFPRSNSSLLHFIMYEIRKYKQTKHTTLKLGVSINEIYTNQSLYHDSYSSYYSKRMYKRKAT